MGKTRFGAVLCGFLMSKKRVSTLLSTGDVDNLSWIFYGMQVDHVPGSLRKTAFEKYHDNRTEGEMDYRELVRRECPDMEPIVSETAAETFFRKELLAKGPDPDREYSIEDFRALPEGLRAELVDGKLIYLEAPTRLHQEITGEMHLAVANHIKSKSGKCKVYIPPFDVYISGDDSRVLEPDLTVVCDRNKLNKKGCTGARRTGSGSHVTFHEEERSGEEAVLIPGSGSP